MKKQDTFIQSQGDMDKQLRNSSFVVEVEKEKEDLRGTFPTMTKSHVVQRKSMEIQHRIKEKEDTIDNKNVNMNNTK